ncbi:thioredoxin family protein [Sulfurimonas sp. SWIR-19]|uniref:thioredoxin family protein n=1 Tax=Sulfurimonas sp. SWIR-19 TaxID=2878390 RepID=UPI001CF2DD99|nr:thioredoxin family protein [Sulfurimonas sp. SWIR-19]UCM99559.1 thioredoxin family protein [Sulfurimonas sp. SWIR-19]
MIKSIVIVTLLTFYANAFMVESSYEKAHAKALKTGKFLVVFLTKKNCSQCDAELAKIIHNKAISLAIDRYAVFVIIKDGQKESYPVEMLYTIQYPALFILDTNELPQCSALTVKLDIQDIVQCLHFD